MNQTLPNTESGRKRLSALAQLVRILMRDGVVLSLDEAAVLADARKMAESVRQAVAPQP